MKFGKEEKDVSSGGTGFLGWLTLLFVGLKLTGYIAWSWVWVLAPLWIPITLLFAIFCIMLILTFIFEGF